jgi:hypothetical protein
MPTIEINDLASLGAILDRPSYMLPPEAWSLAHNMDFRDGVARKMKGTSQVFGTPGVAPHFAMPIQSASQTWWLYTSLTKGYVYDGATHTDITRTSGGDYTAANTRDWNGTILGGIPILNSGTDVPQYWASYSAATKLAALSNWTSTHRCKVMRALGPHLIAGNITKGATLYPHMVKTSHPADPGSLPSSWDQTDETKDATENDLSDVQSGQIMDMMPLRGQMFIYKENAVWRMRFIGGRFVWAYDSFLETIGVLASRCVGVLSDGQKHVVWGQDDVVVHDGQQAYSIVDKRTRKTLFSEIDTTNYLNCFAFDKPDSKQMFLCYPESGQTHPTKALVWNYGEGSSGVFSTSAIWFRNAVTGTVETSDTGTWASDSNEWNTDLTQWSSSSRRRTVILDSANTKFFVTESGEQRDGVNFTTTLRREGLAQVGRKRNGEWIVDFERRKFYNRIWLKITGGPVSVRLGIQELIPGPITWSTAKTFDPSTQTYLDFEGSGRAVSVEISSNANVSWELEGYKLDISLAGNF